MVAVDHIPLRVPQPACGEGILSWFNVAAMELSPMPCRRMVKIRRTTFASSELTASSLMHPYFAALEKQLIGKLKKQTFAKFTARAET